MNGTESSESAGASQEMGSVGRMINVFTSPRRAFESVDTNPSWLLPFIVILTVSVIFILSAQDIIVNDTITQQENAMLKRGLDNEQIEQNLAYTRKAMQFTVFFGIGFTAVILFVVPAVYLFVGNVVLGGRSTYKKVLAVTAHAWLVMSLAGLIMLPMVLAKETMLVSFSLAAFLPDSSVNTFTWQILAKVELFTIWFLTVESIGLAVIYKMKTTRVATAVFVTYILYAFGAAGLSALTSGMG